MTISLLIVRFLHVTNDHHYDVLKGIAFPHVDVIALKDFFELINRNK